MKRERFMLKSLMAVSLSLLAGCAGAGLEPTERPQDFPVHTTDRFFEFHYRLDRGAGEVTAVGLVAATQSGGIEYVILELRGLDKEGRVVSHGYGRTYQGRLVRGTPEQFVVRLTPTGKEDRFELRVSDFGWAQGS